MSRISRLQVAVCAAAVALAAAGCSGVSYNNDFDPTIDFAGYSTYAWVEDVDSNASQGRNIDPLDERRIIAAVDSGLAAKGYRKVTTGRPSFLVNFYVTTQDKIDVSTYHTGWGYYGWYGGTQTSVRQWTEGTLVVDFIDTNEKDLAWRGWATASVDDFARMQPQEKTRRITEIIDGILRQFPPTS
jgi:hypothetical protein